MTTITNIQRELLTRAASEPEGFVDPEIGGRIAKALIRKGLAISLPVEGGASRLVVTGAGRAALAESGQPAEPTGTEPTELPEPPPAAPASRQPKGKLGQVIAMLSRPDGATVAQLMGATGWQAHSVRGAMSGALKKTLGLTIVSDRAEGGERVYRTSASGPPAEEGGADA